MIATGMRFVDRLLCLAFGHTTDDAWPFCLTCGAEVNPGAWEFFR
jgi:hypothetical protein